MKNDDLYHPPMNTYERIFGSGPLGSLIALLLLALAWWLEPYLGLPKITTNDVLRWLIFILFTFAAAALVLWSLSSLPFAQRGHTLITTGAFHYLRHPLYAAFISIFTFGFAVLLNNWIYVSWAILVHILGHWIVGKEETLMRRSFPGEYDEYCNTTGRFVPRIITRR